MQNHRTFGRRGGPRPAPTRLPGTIETVAAVTKIKPAGRSVEHAMIEPEAFPPLDDELRQWKRERKRNFEIPWRPLSLMATLCFGIASFVLPDSVNENVDWLLYALAAASLYAGFRKKHRPAKN